MRRQGGQGEPEAAALARLRIQAHFSPQLFNDPQDDGQPQAMPLDAGRGSRPAGIQPAEGTEEAILQLERHPGPVILHPIAGHRTPMILEQLSPQLQHGRLAAVLEGIAHVVDPHFFDPWPVAQGRGPLRGQAHLRPTLCLLRRQALQGNMHQAAHIQGHHGDLAQLAHA